jgi:hypothetical protein
MDEPRGVDTLRVTPATRGRMARKAKRLDKQFVQQTNKPMFCGFGWPSLCFLAQLVLGERQLQS